MLRFKWYGTASLKIYDDNTSLMFDPFIRYDKKHDKGYISNFDEEKNIFITHGHIDHVRDIPLIYKNKKCNIYCTDNIEKRFIKRGISKDNIKIINYEDSIKIDKFNIKVYESKHIKFNFKLVIKTIFKKDMIKYFKNLGILLIDHLRNPLNNKICLYYLEYEDKSIIVMGSMNLKGNIDYPENVDYLIIAYQGRTDLYERLEEIKNKLKPKKIILTHFDNSFPPISSDINVDIFKDNMNVVIPKYDKEYNL